MSQGKRHIMSVRPAGAVPCALGKLRDESGVSILIALVAIIIAAVISVVITTASVSTLHSVNTDRQYVQTHLTLTSAAQLVGEEIVGTSVKYVTPVKEDGTLGTPDMTSSGTFAAEMSAAVDAVRSYVASDSDYLYKSGSTIKLQVNGLDNMEDLTVSFTMDTDCNVTFLIESAQGDYATVKASCSYDSREHVERYTWHNPVIEGAE